MRASMTVLLGMPLLFVSCVSTSVTRLQPTAGGSGVEVYVSKLPDRPYEEIAFMSSSGSIFHSERVLLRKLKARAAKEQADAIVNVRVTYIPWALAALPVMEGTLIKYKD